MEGPFGVPRPFVREDRVITVVMTGRVMATDSLKRTVVSTVDNAGLDVDSSAVITVEDRNRVDVERVDNRVKLATLDEIESNISNNLAATDLRVNVSEVVVG